MKKSASISIAFVLSVVFTLINCANARAQENAQESKTSSVEFSYTAGAELHSAYIWRGLYNGGLSFQPDLNIGYEGEHTSFCFGTWWNVGASDWGFRKGLDENENGNPNTFFVPEVDVYGSFSFFGVNVGFTHYYYFGGSKYFCWDNLKKWQETEGMVDENTSTTEEQLGYDFSALTEVGLYVNWYTMVAGNDFAYDEDGNITKRNFSSYLELGYDYEFENIGLTLGAQIGMVPWASDYYGTDKFAVTCLSLRAEKAWDFDACSLSLFAQGMINPTYINKDNAYIKASGNDKIGQQTLNGTIGLGVWF